MYRGIYNRIDADTQKEQKIEVRPHFTASLASNWLTYFEYFEQIVIKRLVGTFESKENIEKARFFSVFLATRGC